MSRPSKQATVTLSVDLGYSPSRSFDEMAVHEQFATGLCEQLRDAQLTALWSVADPARDDLVKQVHAEGHTAGILADRAWWVPGINQQQLDRQLTQRIGSAKSAGIEIISVVAPTAIDEHYQLLVSHGVKAVRIAGHKTQAIRPSQVREGLWQTPATCGLPASSKWGLSGVYAVKRDIRKTASAGVTNVVLDLAKLAAKGKAGLRATGSVINFIRSQCDRGELQHRTIESVLNSAAPQRSPGPMKSVLRAA